mgnify:CR=1 FL=1
MTDSPVTRLHARLALRSRPVLTWYGDDDERVELSGPVLAQWVTKAANLLVEELDAGPGYRVLLDLPGHWRTVVWALATWRVGACVVVGPRAGSASGPAVPDERTAPSGAAVDAVLTSSPSAVDGRATIVAVALPALARAFPAPLPDGVLDGSAVLSYGDALGYAPPVDLAAPALVGPTATVTHADLTPAGGPAGRVLVDATAGPLDALLLRVLGILAADGSVVLVGGDYAAALRADDERRARLVASERITVPSQEVPLS